MNDEAFAAARAKRLSRAGKSRRATLAHLAAKGVRAPDLEHDPERELAAACAYLRRRRAGPFGAVPELKSSPPWRAAVLPRRSPAARCA